jgi:hypothetical protein
MFADMLASVSTPLPHNWKVMASPSGRLLFQLAPSVPRTGETGFGLWPTPQAGANNPAAHNAMSGDFKKRFCERANIPMTGTLNPQFVEWLMGFPIGYTALEHSETLLSLKSPN